MNERDILGGQNSFEFQNCYWITLPSFKSSGTKDLCQKWKAKLINGGTLKSLMA